MLYGSVTRSASHLLARLWIALALVVMLALASPGSPAAATDPKPVVVALSGSDAEEVAILDPRSGTVFNRVPNRGQVVMQVFLAPTGDLAAVKVIEEGPTPREYLEIRTLPDWTLRTRVSLGAIPPLQPSEGTTPGLVRDPQLAFASFSSDAREVALAFFATGEVAGWDAPHLVVTSFDLPSGQWAGWARLLGPADYAWLFPFHDRLIVVARSVLPLRTDQVATVYALDRTSGAVLGTQPIQHPAPGILPPRGQTVPSTTASITGAMMHGDELVLLTTDVARIVLATDSLRIQRVDPPLTRELTARSAVLLRDRLVVQSMLDELLVVDLDAWAVRSTYQLPRPDPEAYWTFSWVLVGADPEGHWIYLADIGEGCLRRWDLDTLELSTPLACGLDLRPEWVMYYGWPAFAPGTSEATATLPAPARQRTGTVGVAALALGAVSLLAVLALLVASSTLRRSVTSVCSRIPAWARLPRNAPPAQGTSPAGRSPGT